MLLVMYQNGINIMRALIIEEPRTSFMQAVDMFEKFKVLYYELVLEYGIKDEDGNEIRIIDEELIAKIAQKEFGNKLIALLGATEPKYINDSIKVLSNGRGWMLLSEYIKKTYQNR